MGAPWGSLQKPLHGWLVLVQERGNEKVAPTSPALHNIPGKQYVTYKSTHTSTREDEELTPSALSRASSHTNHTVPWDALTETILSLLKVKAIRALQC